MRRTPSSRVIDASADIMREPPDGADFLHAVMCQVGLPRSHQESRAFTRTSGAVSLRVDAGDLWDGKRWQPQPLPYGTRPRLAMVHISSEAVRTKSPHIEVGDSVHDFLRTLHMDTSGRGYAMFRKQMSALAACRMSIGVLSGDIATTIDAKPIERFDAWLHPTGEQRVLWPGNLTLSEKFFTTLVEHAVPLDKRALRALSHTALGMDIYTWLAHRLCRVRGSVRLSWGNMRDQFGQEYADPKDFKRKFTTAMRAALAVYPQAKVNSIIGGIELRTSPPPLQRTRFLPRT